jgi:two-component system response regulator MprA
MPPVARPARILVTDDDRSIRESLRLALELEGYAPATVADGAQALEAHRRDPADLLVLDLSMPAIDGLTVCRVLRAEGDRIPIIMVTARTETSDRVAGLDAGADDYLAKPFELDELLARIRALLRRAAPPSETGSPTLVVGDLRIDTGARRVFRGDREIELSRTEYALLELLAANSPNVLDHTTIYERIWGYDFGPDSKNLAVYISYLRRKIEAEGQGRLIQTVRGVGYSLRPA